MAVLLEYLYGRLSMTEEKGVKMDIAFWKNKANNEIDPDLFSTKAEDLAKEIFDQSSNKKNKPTQIRKFYDEVLRFSSMLKNKPDDFNNVLPYIKMLNAKVSYALGRDLVSYSFKDFIAGSLSQINDPKDFEVFANFFEAFMGFYKYYYEKTQRKSQGGAR